MAFLVLRILLVLLQCRLALPQALSMVIEGDTYVDIYHNGVFVASDISATQIPLNGVRRTLAEGADAKVVVFPLGLEQGDLVSLRVLTSRAAAVNVTDALGRTSEYPAPAGVILADQNGMMSSSEWKCSTQEKADDNERTPFFYPEFNDSHWLYAYEQPDDCCPWRDTREIWTRVNSQWIGPSPSTYAGNVSGPRQFNCRYRVPGYDTATNLPLAENAKADAFAPVVNITEVALSMSISKVVFNVDRLATVYCGVIDARYQLRPPTHLELKRWGMAMANAVGEEFLFALVGEEFSSSELNATVLARLSVEDLEECEQHCLVRPLCTALEYYVAGVHPQSGTNCKLIEGDFDTEDRLTESPIASFTQKFKYLSKPQHTLTMGGRLFPGTVYNVFCSTEDPANGKHSNYTAVSGTLITQRSEGCFNCGLTLPPSVSVLGGWTGQTNVGIVATASQAGRVYCAAFMANATHPPVISVDTVRERNLFSYLTVTGFSVSIIIADLTESTEYQIACAAESDGGTVSTQAQLEVTRRSFFTQAEENIISSMRITRAPGVIGDEITANAQLTAIGYLWCQVFLTSTLRELGVPQREILTAGDSLKVARIQDLTAVVFPELDQNSSYDVWCTAEYNDFRDDQAGQDLLTPFPKSTVIRIDSSYYVAHVLVYVTKGPAEIFCQAYPWALRPFTERPGIPTTEQLQASPYTTIYQQVLSGMVVIELENLVPGRHYDVYCYSETYVPPSSSGIDTAPRFGMDADAILETRHLLITQGPFFDDLGWFCVSGRPCNVTDLLGFHLAENDQLFVRSDGCPLRCRCNGVADDYGKGAMCSEISQDPTVQAGVGLSDAKDPLGEWCYVDPGLCPDEQASVVSGLMISYKVCTYKASVGLGHRVVGFPSGGVATPYGGLGRDFAWQEPVIAFGGTYDLCWCNGTESESGCAYEADFAVRLGPLHFGGPSELQASAESICRAGLPCSVPFTGQAIQNGSRLVVLPEDPLGCLWRRKSQADPQGLLDFPNVGVSETFDQAVDMYHFHGEPLIVAGGRYNLCWCGPPPQGITRVPGKDYRQPDGIIPPPCPAVRAEDGGAFLSPGGKLVVVGPAGQPDSSCRLGVDCVVPRVLGEGLQGSDRVAALPSCGQAARPPLGWAQGAEVMGPGWTDAGWMTHGPYLPQELLSAFGAPGVAPTGTGNASDRGVYGFPNMGLSVASSKVGYVSWEGPVWAFAGTYLLCWCGADATTVGCKSPADYLVPIGRLIVTGPAVLPLAAQQFRCVRMRQCEIAHVEGTLPPASQLGVAEMECGTAAPVGMPRNGQSLPSADGHHFQWGSERVISNPGRYRLCWCSDGSDCTLPSQYLSYAGILQIKWPTYSPERFFCELGQLCNISGIEGEGLGNNDKVMLLTKCGEGIPESATFLEGAMSVATFHDGTTFLLPASAQSVSYQVCWCPEENTCMQARDFSLALGRLDFGGPVPEVVYRCFEWEPCEIPELDGSSLQDGDRLLVVPDGTSCREMAPGTLQEGIPNSAVTEPATENGTRFTWGDGLVRAAPGHYALCWCSNCSENGPFPTPAGVLRVGSSKEFQFLELPRDRPERGADTQLSWLLAIPLPALFFGAICLGITRLHSRKARAEPEAPSVDGVVEYVDPQRQRTIIALEAREVAETRDNISKLVAQGGKEKFSVLALFGLFRTHFEALLERKAKKAWDKPMPRRLERQGTGLSTVSEVSHVSSLPMEPQMTEYSFGSNRDRPPTTHIPQPPRLDIRSFRSPTAIPGLVDIDIEVEEA